jgi:hypothetical protein
VEGELIAVNDITDNGDNTYTFTMPGENTEAFPQEGLDGVWYSLDGRKLSGKPTQKGLYIHGGKKVVIP